MTRIGIVPKNRAEEKLQLHNLLQVFITPTITLKMQQIEIQKCLLILAENGWTVLSYL